MSTDIKAIAFDMGGVLFFDGKLTATKNLVAKGYDENIISTIYGGEDTKLLRRGLISEETFWDKMKQLCPDHYDMELIKIEWFRGYEIDSEVFEIVKKLKEQQKYKLLIFSGNTRARVQFIEDRYHFQQYFDVGVYSYDYGVSKPSEEFLDAMIAAANCPPNQIVYVDDELKHAAPAIPKGVNLIIYKTGDIHSLVNGLKDFGVEV